MTTPSNESANPYAPPQAEVADASNAGAAPVVASALSRLGAALLDIVINAALIFAPMVIGFDFQTFIDAAAKDDTQGMLSAISPSAFTGAALGALIWAVLTIYFVAKNSQTMGKKIIGIKVLRTDGSHASMARIFWLRNIVNALPSAIPFIGNFYSIIDHLFIFGASRRCLHDRIADTIVVDA